MTQAELLTLIVRRVADLLEVAPSTIDPTQPFSSYGLDSATALLLAAELEDELNTPLPDSLIWEHSTLSALAEHIAPLITEGSHDDVSR